ncbi:hypothetical protein FOZ62_030951 [Perkinsus olseni]|uniref:Uncharacterized protein n=1 Tax=Perkinsus olseni TaxID=32597 RepID=A0A7J6Q308_PEROL|nr:hypothetical protein FOZ62_030951 [Perkinsus olseni]
MSLSNVQRQEAVAASCLDHSHKRLLKPPSIQPAIQRARQHAGASGPARSPEAEPLSGRSGEVYSAWSSSQNQLGASHRSTTGKRPSPRGMDSELSTSRRAAYHLMRERLKLCGGRAGKDKLGTRRRKVVTTFGTAPRFGYRSLPGSTPRRKLSSSNAMKLRRGDNVDLSRKSWGIPECSLPCLGWGGDTCSSPVPSGSEMSHAVEVEVQTSPRSHSQHTASRSSWSDNDSSQSFVRATFTATDHVQPTASRSSTNDAPSRHSPPLGSSASHDKGQQTVGETHISGGVVTPIKAPCVLRDRVNTEVSSVNTSRVKDLSPSALPKLSTRDFLRRVYIADQGATPATTCSTPYKGQQTSRSMSPQTPQLSTPLNVHHSARRKIEIRTSSPPQMGPNQRGIECSMPLQMSLPLSTPQHAGLDRSRGPPTCERSCPLSPCCRSTVIAETHYVENPLLTPQRIRFFPRYRSVSIRQPLSLQRQVVVSPPTPLYTAAPPVTVRSYRVIHQEF